MASGRCEYELLTLISAQKVSLWGDSLTVLHAKKKSGMNWSIEYAPLMMLHAKKTVLNLTVLP